MRTDCDWAEPIKPSRADVLTDDTLAQIVAHNEIGERLCGWKSKFVYVDGALKRPGTDEDYTISFDGFIYSLTFAVVRAAMDVGVISVVHLRLHRCV